MAIPPETSTWVRELLEQEIAKAVTPLRQEMDQLDDWANGLFLALQDVTLALLKHQPALAQELRPLWLQAALRYDQLEQQQGQADEFHETAGALEARKMLYRLLECYRAWPVPPEG